MRLVLGMGCNWCLALAGFVAGGLWVCHVLKDRGAGLSLRLVFVSALATVLGLATVVATAGATVWHGSTVPVYLLHGEELRELVIVSLVVAVVQEVVGRL